MIIDYAPKVIPPGEKPPQTKYEESHPNNAAAKKLGHLVLDPVH